MLAAAMLMLASNPHKGLSWIFYFFFIAKWKILVSQCVFAISELLHWTSALVLIFEL